MGQTLSHGVYLPNEGERNCYAGLASNWQILNTAVGNIAEKAPLVHTHGNISNDGKVGTTANLPLITGTSGVVQAGSFGNSANTFCEGNDSRLSDARTPVAHTHTKADVTDLLNSNFIPSANNSYDLGSSSYQWNNAYIKSLTINGVACGDILTHNVSEFVNVTGAQTITGVKTFASNIIIQGGKKVTCNLDNSFIELNGGTTWGKGGSIVLSGQDRSNYANSVLIVTKSDTDNFQIQYQNGSLKPVQGDNSLGTSTNKWKSLNGVNPGALSLPSSDSTDYIDLSSNLSTNAEYQYTAPSDGWLCLYVLVNEFYQENAVGLYRSDTSANSHQWAKSVTAAINLYKQNRYQGSVMLPVESGKKYICYLSLNANTTIYKKHLFFYKNKGNV